MKISREKTIITIEIEASDAPPEDDLEVLADNIMAGMQLFLANPELQAAGLEAIFKDPKILDNTMRVAQDQREKWELP